MLSSSRTLSVINITKLIYVTFCKDSYSRSNSVSSKIYKLKGINKRYETMKRDGTIKLISFEAFCTGTPTHGNPLQTSRSLHNRVTRYGAPLPEPEFVRSSTGSVCLHVRVLETSACLFDS